MIRAVPVMVINTQGKLRLAKPNSTISRLACGEAARADNKASMEFYAAEQRMSAISLKRIQFLARYAPTHCFFTSKFDDDVFSLFLARYARTHCFFSVCGLKDDTQLVYKHFATLYFVFVFDSCENELAMLDLIQVFVETLDRCFKNVCELDIVFNFNKMHTILDEIVVGGQVMETSSEEVMKAVDEITRFEKSSNAISIVPKSISGRQGR